MNGIIIPKEKNMKVPIRMFVNKKIYPDKKTILLLKNMASIKDLYKEVIALPDIHYKYGKHIPTGIVVATKDKIIPKFVNANCGMSITKTSLNSEDFNNKDLDNVFNFLKKSIAPITRSKPVIKTRDVEEIALNGIKWAIERYNLDKKISLNIENNGSMFKGHEDIRKFIPNNSFDLGKLSLGVLGPGNHFLELQKVNRIINKEIAKKFGLKKEQIVVMLHSDSRAFGLSIYDHYSKKANQLIGLRRSYKKVYYKLYSILNPFNRELLNKTHYQINKIVNILYWKFNKTGDLIKKNYKTIPLNSKEGQDYIKSEYAAINYGFVNRTTILNSVKEALEKNLEKNVKLSLLYDLNHDSIQIENFDGKDLIIHRNGANKAYPKSLLKKHPIFRETGQPVPIPSSMGTSSYICTPTENCKNTFYSLNHGSGRILDKVEARRKFNLKQLNNDLKKRGVRMYRYNTGNIVEEALPSFKNIDEVIKVLTSNKLINPVVELKPIAVLKGS